MTSTMGKTINVRDAHIKTASVEIKSLTASGKQVTMGVFRQLQIEDVIDPETAELVGVPWGTVNYFPKPCHDAPDHLHVVWQKGDELRRACVYRRLDREVASYYKEELVELDENHIKPAAEFCLIHETMANPGERPKIGKDGTYLEWKSPNGCTSSVFIARDGYVGSSSFGTWLRAPESLLSDSSYRRDETWGEYYLEQLASHKIKLLGKLPEVPFGAWSSIPNDPGVYDFVAGYAEDKIREYCKIRDKRDALTKKQQRHYDELAALPQLFIAV